LEVRKVLYIEEIEGKNLFAFCKKNNISIENYRTKLMEQMYLMLERGWIYTDKKIEHILITSEEYFKFIDFGMVDRVANHPDGKSVAHFPK
jgi:tRNA A-37 threonylcarbamoyl transferase component Bud32